MGGTRFTTKILGGALHLGGKLCKLDNMAGHEAGVLESRAILAVIASISDDTTLRYSTVKLSLMNESLAVDAQISIRNI